jgi:hypothetical protein
LLIPADAFKNPGMKAFSIVPPFELIEEGFSSEKSQASISLIARLTFECLRAGGDIFQFAVDWRDPEAPINAAGFDNALAQPHLISLQSDEDLLGWIRRRLEDSVPVSPDPTLAVVLEEPTLLTETDYFDGWIRD